MQKKENDYAKAVLAKLILSVFEKLGNKPLNYKQIAANLNLTDEDSKKTILGILSDETEKGNFIEVQRGKFCPRELRSFLVGKVDMTADGSAFIIPEDELEDDIRIAPKKVRNALHGDLVRVHVFAKGSGRRKEGEVIEIIERAKTRFTGIVKLSERFAFFVTDDRKMLHDIFIPLQEINGAKDGDKAIAEIIDWPEEAKNPIGRIKYVLGKQGENDTEMNAILVDYGFPLSFPKNVENEADAIPGQIPPEEIFQRKDFRGILTFTIDPVDAKDFDDALSFKRLENGNYEVGIHIADVSYYVQPDTHLDKEAYERGTSVYLVDRVIPMLPERLSNELCSLRPHEDKLCFSTVFELDQEANVIHEWFGRTIIHSNKRFTYEDAQELLEQKTGLYSQEMQILNGLAHKLRQRKFKEGAINFESVEVKFNLDPFGKPIGVYIKERKDAHKLIEDFMLLANRRVAEYIGKKGKGKRKFTFVYRSHDAPNEQSLLSFAQFAFRFGYKINTKTNREVARSLNALMKDIEGKKEQNILTQLAIRSMAKAIYTTKKYSHYGLSFEYYTHFTSPIRRYPDIISHRLLKFYLEGGPSVNEEAYEKICTHASEMEKKAADAERASVKYKQAEFLEHKLGSQYKGVISGVTEWGIYVEILENKCEGLIRLRDITDDFYVLDEKNFCIIGQRKKARYQLGDEVEVTVKKVDLSKRQIDFTLAPSTTK